MLYIINDNFNDNNIFSKDGSVPEMLVYYAFVEPNTNPEWGIMDKLLSAYEYVRN